jgi:hypothetical protein
LKISGSIFVEERSDREGLHLAFLISKVVV